MTQPSVSSRRAAWRPLAAVAVCVSFALGVATLAAADNDQAPNLIVNGDFADVDDQGQPRHWPGASDKIQYPEEDGKRFVRFICVNPDEMNLVYREFNVTPGDKLQLTFRTRYQDVKVGKNPWFDARIMMEFRKRDNTKVNPNPGPPNFKGTQAEWKDVERVFIVPEGAEKMAFMPCLFNVASGTFDLADIALRKIGEGVAPTPAPVVEKPAPAIGTALIKNGAFDEADANGNPAHWPGPGKGVSYPVEDGNRFLRLESQEPGQNVMVYRLYDVDPRGGAIRFKFDVRYKDIERGEKSWFDGRIMMHFKDADNKNVPGAPGAPAFRGTRAEWTPRTLHALVPEGAKRLEVMYTLFQAKGGQLDFDNIEIVYVDKADVPPPPASKASPYVEAPPADKLPPPLRVKGNRLVNDAGEEVWLQGVSLASLGWSVGGENIVKSIGVAHKDWNAKVIRLAVRDDFWFGKVDYQNDGGQSYRRNVDSAINAAAALGMYTVLDLHRFRAVREEDVEFWKDAATRYKNHPAVIFELFNEPHDISWKVWRDGGAVSDKRSNTEVIAENNEKLTGFMSPGIQALHNAVRATGANNITVIGGLDWSYDLSGILDGYAIDETPEGRGIMYSTHVYNWKHGWQKAFLNAAEKYPIFVGECGADGNKMDFLVKLGIKEEDPHTWVPDFLAVIQKYRLNWTGWCFHPTSSPRMLLNWDYEPTPFWGVYAQRALKGEIFPMGKLR